MPPGHTWKHTWYCPKITGFGSGSYHHLFDKRGDSLCPSWGCPDSGRTRRNVKTAFHDTIAQLWVNIWSWWGQEFQASYLVSVQDFVFGLLCDLMMLGKNWLGTLLIAVLTDFKELMVVEFNIFEDVIQCQRAFMKGRCVHRLLWHHLEVEKLPDLPTEFHRCECVMF